MTIISAHIVPDICFRVPKNALIAGRMLNARNLKSWEFGIAPSASEKYRKMPKNANTAGNGLSLSARTVELLQETKDRKLVQSVGKPCRKAQESNDKFIITDLNFFMILKK